MERAGNVPAGEDGRIVVLMPVYEDWEAVEPLLGDIDRVFSTRGEAVTVLLVDDGSPTRPPKGFPRRPLPHLGGLGVLRLRRNLGHQRAIAIGLAHVEANVPCRAVVVMDADGEDRAEDAARLVDRMTEDGDARVVFAERARRTEGLVFRVFYQLFKLVHFVLTGERVRVGNFSIVPAALLRRLVVVWETWNHYAAAVFVARLPRTSIPCARGRRTAGRSRMSFVRLVTHGLSAVSVHGETIGVRLLIATGTLIVLVAAALGVTVGVRLLTDLAIPGWATYTVGLLVVILLQAVMAFVMFVFITLRDRQSTTFLPVRDHHWFVDRLDEIELTR